jgi:hypothetical protein
MAKKSLIIYESLTGNTEKVAMRFKQVFEKMGWECDTYKVKPDPNVKHPFYKNPQIKDFPYDLRDYDFLCVGSPVQEGQPLKEMVNILFNNPYSPHSHGETITPEDEARMRANPFVILGPQDPKGIVFVTYSGVHMGPPEALPALASLEHEMVHLRFQCVGRFSCPGGMRVGGVDMPKEPMPAWHHDLQNRPHERDLMKAEIFLEEILEDLH